MHQGKNKGFSLIELMIVIAIIGILASIAVPSYSNYITNARRLDGQVALRNAAQFMERCRTQAFTYVGCNTKTTTPSTSPDGYYALTYSTVAAQTFTITAAPKTGTSQANDSACAKLIINQTGLTSAKDSSDTATSECW